MAIGPMKLLPFRKDLYSNAIIKSHYLPEPQYMKLRILPFIFWLSLIC